MTAPAMTAHDADAEDARRAADAAERLTRFREALHENAERLLPPGLRPLGTRRQEEYNDRQDDAAEALLDEAQADLEAIEDVVERCLTAQALLTASDAYCNDARYQRDIGLIVMLFKHYDGWRQYLLAKRALDDALNARQIDSAEHGRRLSEVADTRRSERSGARWRPTSAGALARVSRGLINSQIKPRIPASLGQALRADSHGPEVPTPTMEEAERMAERYGREVRYIAVSVPKAGVGNGGESSVIPPSRTLRNDAQAVRDACMDDILSGSPEGGLGVQNVILAGALGISTARVAQIRVPR